MRLRKNSSPFRTSNVYPLALFLILLESCAIRGLSDEARIVERSRFSDPEWLESLPKWPDCSQEIGCIYIKSGVVDLELGVKQATAQVLLAFENREFHRLLSLVEKSTPKHVLMMRIQSLSKTVRSHLVTNALISDVFYRAELSEGKNIKDGMPIYSIFLKIVSPLPQVKYPYNQ